eukprot:GHVT01083101.1.p4 GENE.GHVT01083101.1~~GHVT01083101.1.p4  ORF type:complete len:113 (+),score=3.52 GHVT01083101.1:1742-2080(+)
MIRGATVVNGDMQFEQRHSAAPNMLRPKCEYRGSPGGRPWTASGLERIPAMDMTPSPPHNLWQCSVLLLLHRPCSNHLGSNRPNRCYNCQKTYSASPTVGPGQNGYTFAGQA